MPGHVMEEAGAHLYVEDFYQLADSFDDGFLAFLSRFLELKGPLEIAAGNWETALKVPLRRAALPNYRHGWRVQRNSWYLWH